jgi:hypothetical protein
MNRFLAAILAMLLPACSGEPTHSWETDPVESRVGIHIISNFGDDPAVFSSNISAQAVQAALQRVDWVNGFHQVVVVISPGVSMEVGGSLNPGHGLSAVYRNRPKGIEAVSKDAPESISGLEAILLAFLRQDDSWQKVQEFTF